MSELKQNHADIVSKYINDAAERVASGYMITISRDGEYPARSIFHYNNIQDALDGYNMYKDAGFAKNYLTVSLYEPCGNVNSKVLKRNQAGDPSFVRQNYIDVTDALYLVKDKLNKEDYEKLCVDIVTSFAKDNWRFDAERFLSKLEIDIEV
jgi:hypothetical protein